MPRRRADPDAAAAQTVQRVLNETRPGLDAHQTAVRGYDRSYEVWRSPDNPREREGRPKWRPLFKIPYAMQSIDQAMVAVAQGVPAARCTARNPQSVAKAKAMEQTLGYYADLAHLAEKVPIVVQQALVYGPSPAKTSWLYEEDGRGRVLHDRPDMQPLDVYDVWWDPAASDVDSASYVVCRYWPSKEELEKRRYDDKTGKGAYRNLDLLYQSGVGAPRPQTRQNQILDDNIPAVYKDRFEVWEVWRNDRLTVLGNRQILLYDGAKPYTMPGKPVTISHVRPDFFRIAGIAETELLDHVQQNLQAHDNLLLEGVRFTVQRGITYRETIPDAKALVIQPNFAWPVQDHDDVRFVDQPPLPPEAYREHERLLSLTQLITGVNAYVTGASAGGGVDQTTATGVTLLSNSASRLLVFKAQLISNLTWQRSFEQWGHLTRQYLMSPVDVEVPGPGETRQWITVGPDDIHGEYDVRIESAEESLNKQQKKADLLQFLNAVMPAVATGQVDPRPIYRALAEAFNFPSPEALFPDVQATPQAAPYLNGNQPAQAPAPHMLGGQLAPQPMMSILAGNQR